MGEAELQEAVIETARLFGWKVAHFRPARTERGWRTPVAADGAGFPDLILARAGRPLLCVELKSAAGRISAEQAEWLRTLEQAQGSDVRLWRPNDWLSGEIEKALR
jgi:hypothetical protein